jgi:hypothetical protein
MLDAKAGVAPAFDFVCEDTGFKVSRFQSFKVKTTPIQR